MALPIPSFASLTSPQPLSDFDLQFAAVAALGVIPCTATGTNAIALAPFANTPTISSYPDLSPSFAFVAQNTSTGAVTINVNSVGVRNAYKWNGQAGAGAGDVIGGLIYIATPLQALNSGSGGFVINSAGVSNNSVGFPFVIDGGGNPITTGVKGFLPVPFAANIAAWSIIADQSGSISVDILRANNAVPSSSIVGAGTKPNLTAQQFVGQTAPVSWSATALAFNDYVGFSVASASTVTRVTVTLWLLKL